jgi:nitrate reductase cytochrome c-type subunit
MWNYLNSAMALAREAIVHSLEKPLVKINDPLDVSSTIAVYIGILILILILLTIVLERLRFNRQAVTFLRLFALCVFPVFILPFASFSTFEGSHKVQFCQTCHTAMNLYVGDMMDDHSDTLSAVHFKNRYIQDNHCYKCHAGYSVFDIGKAKATGLIHLYYWISRSPTAMGKEQIKLYGKGGYKNKFCLNCHSGSRGFLEAEEGVHRAVGKSLLGEDPVTGASLMSCLFCHGPAHLTLEQKKSPKILMANGIVEGQPGVNRYPAIEPGKSTNQDRPYDIAPPVIPHKVAGYKITRSHNSCLEPCHLKGIEKVPPSHFINPYKDKRLQKRVVSYRYHCLQCHLPQVSREPLVVQKSPYVLAAHRNKGIQRLIAVESGPEPPAEYLGVRVCALCHQSKSSGNQYGKWKIRNHAKAYRDLATERGKQIARSMGISEEPQKSKTCLKCHSTGFDSNNGINPEYGFNIADGVQCEQCHGAGSQYMNLPTMKNLALGIIDRQTVGLKMPDKRVCLRCHNPIDKHINPFNKKERFRKINHWK